MRFADRTDAGRQLAAAVAPLDLDRPVVLALPRGGVPVGYEVARALNAPLDVLIVRKIGAPDQPELAVGAVAEGGQPELDAVLLDRLGLDRSDLAETIAAEQAELERRLRSYRGHRDGPQLAGATVVVVDDGLATGASAGAALRAVRRRGPARVVLAVPVAAPESVDRLRDEADDVVAVLQPRDFLAVGRWYADFTQTTDGQVIALLGDAGAAAAPGAGTEAPPTPARTRALHVPSSGGTLPGDLTVPPAPHGVVVFAHGSGSSRFSTRNRQVAQALLDAGLATLLLDLLTEQEEAADARTGHLRFDVDLLAGRVVAAIAAIRREPLTASLPLGLFGASTGAAAALIAAAREPDAVGAIVSRGGRPDLADAALPRVAAPTLLLVGERDTAVLGMNREAAARLVAPHHLQVIPRAGHLFEEPGTLEAVADAAVAWFGTHL